MGSLSRVRIVILLVLLATVGIGIYREPADRPQKPSVPLAAALATVPGWQQVSRSMLDPKIVSSLKLDDYLMAVYRDGHREVSLYVGYYRSAGKVGAAHDPLVCFPGQGWQLQDRVEGTLMPQPKERPVRYSTMIARHDVEEQRVVYWFQAFDRATSNTFSQKLLLWRQRLSGEGDANAFVRVSCSMNGRAPGECQKNIAAFIRRFYPVFLDYMRQSGSDLIAAADKKGRVQ